MELSYEYICSTKDDIPKEALAHLDDAIINNIGNSFSTLFPRFSKEFEKTTFAIETHWSRPKLAIKKGLREWIAFLVVQSTGKKIFFHLQPEFMEKKGELFNEDYQMLPKSWVEIYRWFNSFCVTEKDHALMDWWNTPFRYEARLDLDDYEKASGSSRKSTKKFSQTVGCDWSKLRCWLLTENEDAFFINEEKLDGKLYHVKGKNLDQITEIKDPRKVIDDYLADYLSEGSVPKFDFANV